MNRRLPVLLLFLATLTIALVYLYAMTHALGQIALSILAIAISLATTSIMAFGLPRNSRRARIFMSIVLVLTFVVVSAGFCIAIFAGTPLPNERLFGGLPRGAAAAIYLVGLLPLLVLPIVYALTFEDARK